MSDGTKTVLAVGAHPDDVEFGAGGAILKMRQAGWKVVIVDLTNGEPTPFGSEERRAQEAARAAAILGIEDRLCLDMPNRYLAATLENRRALAQVVRKHRPMMVVGPCASDIHPDHNEAAALVETARFEAKLHKTTMRDQPHWAPWLYRYHSIHTCPRDVPSFVIDVTDVWDRKIAAIRAYESQLKNHQADTGNYWLDRIEVMSRHFGQLVDCRYGEPFFGSAPLGSRELALLGELGP